MTTSRTTEQGYEVGTLIIALFDVEREEMIFTATGSKTLSTGTRTPEESQARVNEVVGEILKDFPPERD